MTLKELRIQFGLKSGRYDLVNDDGSDAGADLYINAGQRYLDLLTQYKNATATNYQLLRVREDIFYLKDCRAVHRVSYVPQIDADLPSQAVQQWIPLIRKSVSEIRSQRGTVGDPIMYCLAAIRASQDTANAPNVEFFSSMAHMAELVAGQFYDKTAVCLVPAPIRPIQVEVEGLFYCTRLVTDNDTSYWAAEHPMLLLQAAFRELEIFHRNTQGVADWDNAIRMSLMLLEQDHIYGDSYSIDQMEG